MNIAGLRVRITIQQNSTKIDSIGNHTSAWTDYFSCWATASNQTGNEDDEGSTADEEDRMGSLEVGKLANMAVFDKDFLKDDLADIENARCLATFVDGEQVYKA